MQLISTRRFRKFIGQILNPHNINFQSSLYSRKEYYNLVKRMDRGQFNFSDQEFAKMKAQYINSGDTGPMPTKLRQIMNQRDAKHWNQVETIDLLYKLPNVFAYEEQHLHSYQNLIDLLKQKEIELNNQVIIDCGCGIGTLLKLIHDQYPQSQLYGIEVSKTAIEIINKRTPYIHTLLDDFQSEEDLNPELHQKGDVVVSREVLEHLKDPALALKKLYSLKHPQGVLVITVPDGDADYQHFQGRHPVHLNFWNCEQFDCFVKDTLPSAQVTTSYVPSKYALGQRLVCALIH